MMQMMNLVLAACLTLACQEVQAVNGSEQPVRVEIGAGFSIAQPAGKAWLEIGAPGAYFMPFAPDGHGLLLVASVGPSGISHEDLMAAAGASEQDRLVRLAARFVTAAWKAHRASLAGERFEKIEVANEVGGKFAIGKFLCGYSRISGRDRGALVDGAPAHVRYVGYSCVEFSDLSVAATVSYLERGRAHELSDEAMALGERFARSLQRRACAASHDAASVQPGLVRTALSQGSGQHALAGPCP